MWFCGEESINKKLGYLNHLCDLDAPDKIKYLKRFKHENLHEWIQLLREQKQAVEQDRDNREFKKILEVKLKEISNKTLLLAKYIINNPEQAKGLIGIVCDLLGRNPLLFTSINLAEREIAYLLAAIKINKYQNYPYVILARYIQLKEREQFVRPIIEYADQLNNNMAWAMTGEACETLAYLNCCPEESMKCLAQHLNDGDCDGYPGNNIIKSMHVFKQYGNLIVDELVKYLDELGVDVGDTPFEIKYLSYFVNSKEVAEKLLDPIINALGVSDISEFLSEDYNIWDDDSYAKSSRLILLFYGQLQAIIHGHL